LNSISCIWLELGRKRNRSIEESLKPKPRESKTQSGPLPQPNFLSFPSPRGPRTLPEPTHERPSLSPPRPNPTRLPGQLASPPRPAQTSPARSRASARVTLSPTPPLTARAHGAEPSPSPVCPAPGCPAPLRPCVACAVDLLNPVAPPASYRAPPTF